MATGVIGETKGAWFGEVLFLLKLVVVVVVGGALILMPRMVPSRCAGKEDVTKRTIRTHAHAR